MFETQYRQKSEKFYICLFRTTVSNCNYNCNCYTEPEQLEIQESWSKRSTHLQVSEVRYCTPWVPIPSNSHKLDTTQIIVECCCTVACKKAVDPNLRGLENSSIALRNTAAYFTSSCDDRCLSSTEDRPQHHFDRVRGFQRHFERARAKTIGIDTDRRYNTSRGYEGR